MARVQRQNLLSVAKNWALSVIFSAEDWWRICDDFDAQLKNFGVVWAGLVVARYLIAVRGRAGRQCMAMAKRI